MSTISPDQLPTPFWPGAPATTSNQTGRPAGRPGRAGLISAAVAGLVLLGGAGLVAFGGSDTSPSSTRNDERGGERGDEPDRTEAEDPDVRVTTADLDRAYAMVFGVQGSPATLDCVAGEIESDGDELAADVLGWADGGQLSLAAAQRVFTPFVGCAPDADFLAEMVPAAVQVVGGAADEGCITATLLNLGLEGRAEAHALAYADPGQFVDRMYSTFVGCAI